MDQVKSVNEVIRELLSEFARIPPALGQVTTQFVADEQQQQFLLITYGRDEQKQPIYYCAVHLDLSEERIIVRCDNMEPSIVEYLVASGIPRQQITYPARDSALPIAETVGAQDR